MISKGKKLTSKQHTYSIHKKLIICLMNRQYPYFRLGGEIITKSDYDTDTGRPRITLSSLYLKMFPRSIRIHLLNNLMTFESRVAQPVTPEMLLQQVLGGIRDGSYSQKIKGIPIKRLVNHIQDYYNKFKQNSEDSENLKFAKAFANLIYLLDPDYKNPEFDIVLDAVTHSWLEFIPKSIKAARPIRSIPGEVIERLAIPLAKPAEKTDSVIQLPATQTAAKPVEEKFNVEDLKKAKYVYKTAEFCFVMRDYITTQKSLFDVLSTPYMNVDANNLLVQNSILWSEDIMQKDEFNEALTILSQTNVAGMDSSTADLINDKIKEATVLHKITILEDKCPLNEHSVGKFLRKRIGYKKFLRLTYFIFGNIEFHQRLEEMRVFPKKMIYPLLKREPTPETEEAIVKRHEMHEGLIRELYDWFWNLDIVKHYLSTEIKNDLTEKFGEYGSGPVIYFRYISKGQYANIIISKSVELVGQGDIQEAKKELYQTYELTGSKKIKGYLDFLRQHEKAKKTAKKKAKAKKKKKKKKKEKKKTVDKKKKKVPKKAEKE